MDPVDGPSSSGMTDPPNDGTGRPFLGDETATSVMSSLCFSHRKEGMLVDMENPVTDF